MAAHIFPLWTRKINEFEKYFKYVIYYLFVVVFLHCRETTLSWLNFANHGKTNVKQWLHYLSFYPMANNRKAKRVALSYFFHLCLTKSGQIHWKKFCLVCVFLLTFFCGKKRRKLKEKSFFPMRVIQIQIFVQILYLTH